jgi:hypothetical protein
VLQTGSYEEGTVGAEDRASTVKAFTANTVGTVNKKRYPFKVTVKAIKRN